MSNAVFYEGKRIGSIKLDDDGKYTHKFVYIAEGLDSLAKLLNLKPNDVIELEGVSEMSYEKFKQEHLNDMIAFYPDQEAWFLKDVRAKSIEELDKEQRAPIAR